MKTVSLGKRGSATFGLASALLLLVASLGGWYATWHHYHYGGSTPICTVANARLSIGTTEGTAGTLYTHVVVTNQGSMNCMLNGYPTAFLTDASNAQLGSGAAANSLYTPSSITLAPGQSAHTTVGFPDHNNFSDPTACSAVSTNLELYLPAAITPLSAPLAQYSCPGFSSTAFQSGA